MTRFSTTRSEIKLRSVPNVDARTATREMEERIRELHCSVMRQVAHRLRVNGGAGKANRTDATRDGTHTVPRGCNRLAWSMQTLAHRIEEGRRLPPCALFHLRAESPDTGSSSFRARGAARHVNAVAQYSFPDALKNATRNCRIHVNAARANRDNALGKRIALMRQIKRIALMRQKKVDRDDSRGECKTLAYRIDGDSKVTRLPAAQLPVCFGGKGIRRTQDA